MQHPHLPPSQRSLEVLQRFRNVLAITAAAYGLNEKPDAPRSNPGGNAAPARQPALKDAPGRRAESRPKSWAVAG